MNSYCAYTSKGNFLNTLQSGYIKQEYLTPDKCYPTLKRYRNKICATISILKVILAIYTVTNENLSWQFALNN